MLNNIEHILLRNFAGILYFKDNNKDAYKFITGNKYFLNQKNIDNNFYDFLDNKSFEYLPETSYKFQAEGVPVETDVFKLDKLEDNDKDKINFYEKYFDNILISVHETKKFENEELNDKVLSWEGTEKDELIFFAKEEYDLDIDSLHTKSEIINLLKEEYLIKLRDIMPHNIKRLMQIFNINEEKELFDTTNTYKINEGKKKWLEILNKRKDYTFKILKKEYKSDDEELKNEINSIKQEILSKIEEFKSINFASLAEVSAFWPIILYPKPTFSYITVTLKKIPVITNANNI